MVASPALATEQVPGFFGISSTWIFSGGGEDVGLVVCGFNGQDVSSVGGEYVGGEEVDLGGAVGTRFQPRLRFHIATGSCNI